MQKNKFIIIFAGMIAWDVIPYLIRVLHGLPSLYTDNRTDSEIGSIVFLAFVAILIGYLISRIKIDRKITFFEINFTTHIFISFLILFLTAIVKNDGMRYQGGAFFGFAGMLYVLNMTAWLSLIFVSVGSNLTFYRIVSLNLYFIFQLLNSDGDGSILLIASSLAIFNRIGVVSFAILISVLISILVYVKFGSDIPDFEILISWILSRLSIRMESFALWLTGKAIVGDFLSYLNLISISFIDRLYTLFSGNIRYHEYKSLSDAIYYDIHGFRLGGSSPGFLYSMYQTWMIFGVLAAYLIKKFLFKITSIPFMGYLAFIYIFANIIFADAFEIFLLISPSFLYFLVFFLSCKMRYID